MAWLVVNKDSEYGLVFDEKPQRIGCHWEVEESIFNNQEFGIPIETNSVIKLVGRQMHWEDKPVEI